MGNLDGDGVAARAVLTHCYSGKGNIIGGTCIGGVGGICQSGTSKWNAWEKENRFGNHVGNFVVSGDLSKASNMKDKSVLDIIGTNFRMENELINDGYPYLLWQDK